jgi:hypothetical protein
MIYLTLEFIISLFLKRYTNDFIKSIDDSS